MFLGGTTCGRSGNQDSCRPTLQPTVHGSLRVYQDLTSLPPHPTDNLPSRHADLRSGIPASPPVTVSVDFTQP